MKKSVHNEKYKSEVSKYTKKDAIIALCLFVYVCLVSFLWGFIGVGMGGIFTFRSTEALVATNVLVYSLILVVPCIAIVLIRKQGLASIGIHKKHLGAALLLGLCFSIITHFLYSGLFIGLIQEWQFRTARTIMWVMIITILNAYWEDIVFTGFIQTRLYGIIKNDIFALLAGGLLFAVMHIPMRLAIQGPSAFATLISLEMPGWIGMHIVFNLVFRKYFSIFPVIMLHTFANFSATGEFWASGVSGLHDTISFIIIVLTVVVWMLYSRYRSKTTSEK